MCRLLAAFAALAFLASCANTTTSGKRTADRGYYEATIDYWIPEAQRGDPLAIFNLGLMAEAGAGMPQDRERAIRFFTFAARMGLPAARTELARLGAPVPQADRVRRVTTDDLALVMSMEQQQQLPAYLPVAPPARTPMQTNCTSDKSDKYCTTY